MIYLLLVFLAGLLLPTIHYLDVVDEKYDKHPYRPFKHWWPVVQEPTRILDAIRWKLYGAWTFKDRAADRLSVIVTYLLLVFVVYKAFGFNTALFWSTMPMTLFVSVWRNGRRYALTSLVCVAMMVLPWWGVALYPLVAILQPGGVFAGVVYMIDDRWPLAFATIGLFAVSFKTFKAIYEKRSKKKPRVMRSAHPLKFILVFKTLSYFVYRTLVPGLVFIYEPWTQSYGVDKNLTRSVFVKDRWFYSGLVIAVALAWCVWYPTTRLGALWFLVFFAPYSNFVTNHQHNNLRYAILPAIGLVNVVAMLVPEYLIVMAGINVFFLVRSMEQFICDESTYVFHFKYSPASIAPYVIMCNHHIKLGNNGQALQFAERGLHYSPAHYGLLMMRAMLRGERGQIRELKDLVKYQTFAPRNKLQKRLEDIEKTMDNASADAINQS